MRHPRWSVFTLLQETAGDVHYGIRQLWKVPVFAATAVITIALGISTNVTVFTILNAYVLRPLPYRDADRLVLITETLPRLGLENMGSNYENFADWKRQVHGIEELAAYRVEGFSIRTPDGAERVSGALISTDTFQILGVQPALGHDFAAGNGAGNADVVLISYDLWTRSFGRNTQIVGTVVTVNGSAATVIGVMPPRFRFPETSDAWMPLLPRHDRGNNYLQVLGRLRRGTDRTTAQTEMQTIVEGLIAQFPKTNVAGTRIAVLPLHDAYVGNARTPLVLLLGAVSLVLLLACTNVAHLLLSRSELRQREMSVRNALGASRSRLARQLLVESSVLSLLGGGAGFAASSAVLPILVRAYPAADKLPFWVDVRADWRVLVFTIGVSTLSAIGFGLAPAIRCARSDRSANLLQSRTSAGRKHRWINQLLIASEIAVALVLSIGAGLLMRSFAQLEKVDPGFDFHNHVSARILLNNRQYPGPDSRRALYAAALQHFGSIPDVDEVAGVSQLPLGGSEDRTGYILEGEPVEAVNFKVTLFEVITPGYFRVLRIPLIRGGDFSAFDLPNGQPVAIVDEAFARKNWPGQDPVGKRIRFSPDAKEPIYTTVIGVAGNVRMSGLKIEDAGNVYFNYLQYPVNNTFTFVMRIQRNPASVIKSARQELARIDPQQPLYNVRTLTDVVSASITGDRLLSVTLQVFAALAVCLGLVGIYGVVSYAVEQRRTEMGIRIALGGNPNALVRSVLSENLRLITVGVAAGLMAAFGLGRVLTGILVNVSTTDYVTLVTVSALITAAALLACAIPARRIARIDPVESLRHD